MSSIYDPVVQVLLEHLYQEVRSHWQDAVNDFSGTPFGPSQVYVCLSRLLTKAKTAADLPELLEQLADLPFYFNSENAKPRFMPFIFHFPTREDLAHWVKTDEFPAGLDPRKLKTAVLGLAAYTAEKVRWMTWAYSGSSPSVEAHFKDVVESRAKSTTPRLACETLPVASPLLPSSSPVPFASAKPPKEPVDDMAKGGSDSKKGFSAASFM